MKTKIVLSLVSLLSGPAFARAGETAAEAFASQAAVALVQTHADYVWTLLAAALVFFMQAGFAMIEAGMTRAKNAVNIMMKNLMDVSIGTLAFWAVGFGLMFGSSATGWFGTSGFFLSAFHSGRDPWVLAFWMFQVVFAATAATIVSGAMAERTRFVGYLLYSLVISGLVYPIFGSWAWGGLLDGGGWLERLGFIDFAGSTVVHSVGGWAALAGALVIGPRLGKYAPDGRVRPLRGHNLPLAALGVFILWLGWFGFNAGSTTAASKATALIFVNTHLAAAAGGLTAMLVSWRRSGKAEIGMSLNGTLSGLVAITSPCATVSPLSAVVIGGIAGVLVVFAIVFFERVRIDDPVGAISVHGINGAWGTLAAGVFNDGGTSLKLVGVQLLGIAACFAWVFPVCYLTFRLIDRFWGLRVSAEEELAGLDLTEHGGEAYPDFTLAAQGTSVSGRAPGWPPSGARPVFADVVRES